MEVLKAVNLGLRFILEIAVLFILGYWGFKVFDQEIWKIIVGIGTPLLVAVIWWMFGAPKGPYRLNGLPFLLLEIVAFGSAAVALYFIGQTKLAIVYGLILVVNLTLTKIWNQ